MVGFLDEVRNLGLTVLPPKVNQSAFMFEAVTPDTIQYGLGAIKGVGQGACEAVVEERLKGGPFKDLLDFCTRVGSAKLNRRTLEAMINCGALDELGRNRASLMLQLPEVIKATDQMARERASGQNSLFGGPDPSTVSIQLDLPEAEEWPLLQRLNGERDTLGFYLSGHPFDPWRDDVRDLVGNDLGSVEKIWSANSGGGGGGEKRWRPEVQTVLAGQVVGVRRKGESQIFIQLEDGRGRVECSAFSDAMAEFGHLMTKDRILVVKGGLREDEFNGGYALRIRQCWDFDEVCANYATRLSLRRTCASSARSGSASMPCSTAIARGARRCARPAAEGPARRCRRHARCLRAERGTHRFQADGGAARRPGRTHAEGALQPAVGQLRLAPSCSCFPVPTIKDDRP